MSELIYNSDIKRITTFNVSANAACIAYYDTLDELKFLLADRSLPRPIKHLGEGSNMLFTKDFPGTILISRIDNHEIIDIREDGTVLVRASAGVIMDNLCRDMALKNIWGLENLSGIPGTVGASVIQNVGAYGVEAGDLIVQAEAIEIESAETVSFSHDMIDFGYRHSIFKTEEMRDRFIITDVVFKLSSNPQPRTNYANLQSLVGNNPSAIEMRNAVISIRDNKLPSPAIVGSAGSFFKNPIISQQHFDKIKALFPNENVPCFIVDNDQIKIPAAWLIDKAGCKSMSQGGAFLWQSQPLVIVNISGNATPQDIIELEQRIIKNVKSQFDITLHPEVEHI